MQPTGEPVPGCGARAALFQRRPRKFLFSHRFVFPSFSPSAPSLFPPFPASPTCTKKARPVGRDLSARLKSGPTDSRPPRAFWLAPMDLFDARLGVKRRDQRLGNRPFVGPGRLNQAAEVTLVNNVHTQRAQPSSS